MNNRIYYHILPSSSTIGTALWNDSTSSPLSLALPTRNASSLSAIVVVASFKRMMGKGKGKREREGRGVFKCEMLYDHVGLMGERAIFPNHIFSPSLFPVVVTVNEL